MWHEARNFCIVDFEMSSFYFYFRSYLMKLMKKKIINYKIRFLTSLTPIKENWTLNVKYFKVEFCLLLYVKSLTY